MAARQGLSLDVAGKDVDGGEEETVVFAFCATNVAIMSCICWNMTVTWAATSMVGVEPTVTSGATGV